MTVGVVGCDDSRRPSPASNQIELEAGDLDVVVGDHQPTNHTGVHALSHRLRASDVFEPAGLIGLRRECRIDSLGPDGAVLSVGEGQATIREEYVVRAPHYLDYTVRFTASQTTEVWNSTSYMNGPSDPAIYLVRTDGSWARHFSPVHGQRASVPPASMDPLPPASTPPRWDESYSDLRFDPQLPLFYGRFDDMVLVFMIEPRWGHDVILFMSPDGGGYNPALQRDDPAWDYRFWLRGLTPGQEVVIRSRLVYKPWVGQDDVLDEYRRWTGALD